MKTKLGLLLIPALLLGHAAHAAVLTVNNLTNTSFEVYILPYSRPSPPPRSQYLVMSGSGVTTQQVNIREGSWPDDLFVLEFVTPPAGRARISVSEEMWFFQFTQRVSAVGSTRAFLTPVPEPQTWMTLAAGLMVAGFVVKRRTH